MICQHTHLSSRAALTDTVKAAADSFNAKVIDLQNYMKLTRGFTFGDTGAGTAGICNTGTVGSNYQTLLQLIHLYLHSHK